MRIAMMVRGYIPVPRPADMVYAPIDLAVAIAEGLARKGHQVDFYAPLGTRFHGAHINVRTLNLRPLVHNQQETSKLYHTTDLLTHYVPELWDQYMARDMLARANRGCYDVLHFHHPEVALAAAKAYSNVPIVYTLHDPVFPWYRELFELYATPNQHYISISNNQRRDAPDLPYIANIYNGVSTHNFPFGSEAEDYLLYVGRVVPEKGVKEAVQVARETNHRLLIIGPTYPDGQDYFDQYIKPYLNDRILYLGYIERHHLPKYYQKAKALLTPIQWEEAFGLTTIEAMACGTPVISLRRGAAPEIIQSRKTGFVVDSITEMISAVQRIDRIDRRACREHVKQHFSLEQMVDAYEAVFAEFAQPARRVLRRTQIVRERLKRVPFHLGRPLRPDQSCPAKQLFLRLK